MADTPRRKPGSHKRNSDRTMNNGVLSSRGITVPGRRAHRMAVHNANAIQKRAERRVRCWDAFCDGMTMRAIAKQEGIGLQTVWTDIDTARKELEANGLMDRERLRARQQALTDRMYEKHGKKLKDRFSAKIVLDVMDREARLNGLDAKRDDLYTAEQVMSMLRGLFGDLMGIFTERDQRLALAGAFRKRADIEFEQAKRVEGKVEDATSEVPAGTPDADE